MKLLVNHQTHYRYTESARNSVQSIKMMPQSSLHQNIETWHISVPGLPMIVKRDALIIYG